MSRRTKGIGTGWRKKKNARLIHSDYDCGGIVHHHSDVGLRCTKCRMSSALGPLSVVTGLLEG